ncbi:putative Fe-S cluster assembly protein SufT [Thauera linaloolentis]|uniref:FeS assembly SUF system protein SufT n=1 Tax=Thauera linaloolentis (strain DSM 12138 / JCM 21573 / CCUG 41526 / CIP 105981 / IAM 15112 / NBRC 102519 / 47Lol) TaxID=1123367 RepID=N6Y6V9_THAL4|nr:putative Fe-S cluster assembly protein SufT [Thauera linaloolentis]ENO89941.1 FeS assembly SUF system protein SufT [Thauera linaloolentis 47Lol = DSM 12138]MCM8566632.1 putative Fe-S cluster assembly protein SufT [Thauera linaloolentis]
MGERYAETESRVLARDCDAVSVPWGRPETLPEGAHALVTQRLGGSITVMCGGNLYRIAERDADALGLEPRAAAPRSAPAEGELDADTVERSAWEVLGTCYDPEIPIDIVNLGLVYGCTAEALPEGGFRLAVRMTLTAPGCGMGTLIADEAREKLLELPGVTEATVELAWDPPWSREMMSEAARLEMGMF